MHFFFVCLLPLGISATHFTVLGYDSNLVLRDGVEPAPKIRMKLQKKLKLSHVADNSAAKVALNMIDHDHKLIQDVKKLEGFAEKSENDIKKLSETVKVTGAIGKAKKLAADLVNHQPKEEKLKPKLSALINNLQTEKISNEELDIIVFLVAIGSSNLQSIVDEVVPTQGTETEKKAQQIKDTLVEQETDKLKLKLKLRHDAIPAQKKKRLFNSMNGDDSDEEIERSDEEIQDLPYGLPMMDESKLFDQQEAVPEDSGKKRVLAHAIPGHSESQKKSLCLFTTDRQYCVYQMKKLTYRPVPPRPVQVNRPVLHFAS